MLTVGVCGISGRMGTAILRELLARGHTLGAAFDAPTAPNFGKDAAALVNRDPFNVKIKEINDADVSRTDGLIDFSMPEATMQLLPAALRARKPLVIGTTGFSEDQRKKIEEAAAEIPVLLSPNMSIQVNLLFRLTEMAAKVLQNDYDVEVFEAHHRLKKDAPSGTAKKLIEMIKNSVKDLSQAREVYGRSGITGERTKDEIGVTVLRGGDIVGEHTVYFAGTGERLELTHRATNREVFARGAVPALEYLSRQKPGMYSMFDVLGL